MPKTRTAGITLDAHDCYLIDKLYRGVRIKARLRSGTQEEAEERLKVRMREIDLDLELKANPKPTFGDCADRFLFHSREKRSLEAIEIHIRMLKQYVGHLEPHQVHDATLAPLISSRIADGVTALTINRTLEIARAILNRAARSYRDDKGRPWMHATPPWITMLPECPRPAYPITWEEQDRLLPNLPSHLQKMVLFALNTGLRNGNVCGLRWEWEIKIPETGRSVFVIPSDCYKARRDHVVILNDAAWSIIEIQRGLHSTWVFPFRGRRISTMNNTAWQKARQEVGLKYVRVHDLRHTFASRLRAAGVSDEDRCTLMGHASHSMAGHYASGDVGRLLKEANLVLNRSETRTVLRVVSTRYIAPGAFAGKNSRGGGSSNGSYRVTGT